MTSTDFASVYGLSLSISRSVPPAADEGDVGEELPLHASVNATPARTANNKRISSRFLLPGCPARAEPFPGHSSKRLEFWDLRRLLRPDGVRPADGTV